MHIASFGPGLHLLPVLIETHSDKGTVMMLQSLGINVNWTLCPLVFKMSENYSFPNDSYLSKYSKPLWGKTEGIIAIYIYHSIAGSFLVGTKPLSMSVGPGNTTFV